MEVIADSYKRIITMSPKDINFLMNKCGLKPMFIGSDGYACFNIYKDKWEEILTTNGGLPNLYGVVDEKMCRRVLGYDTHSRDFGEAVLVTIKFTDKEMEGINTDNFDEWYKYSSKFCRVFNIFTASVAGWQQLCWDHGVFGNYEEEILDVVEEELDQIFEGA